MDYARMMEATTVGFMIGAVFLNRGHFDLVYHWIALVTSLSAIVGYHWLRQPEAQQQGARSGSITVAGRSRFGALPALGNGVAPRWGR
jgi:hypothetical protein